MNELDLLKQRIQKLEQIIDFFVRPDRYVFERPISQGTKGLVIGKSGEKIGFFGVTPVVQHSSTGETGGASAGSGTTVFVNTTFQGGAYATGYTISDVVKALKEYGMLLP